MLIASFVLFIFVTFVTFLNFFCPWSIRAIYASNGIGARESELARRTVLRTVKVNPNSTAIAAA